MTNANLDEEILDVKLPKVSDSALLAYMKQVRNYPLLSREETDDLVCQYKHPSTSEKHRAKIHTKLVSHNLRLVVSVAYKFKFSPSIMMDLIQEGNLGLMRGIEKYDPSFGVPLSSYVCNWIKALMVRYTIQNHRLIRLGTTQDQRKIFWNLSKLTSKFETKGVKATTQMLADELNVTEKEIIEMQLRMNNHEKSLYDLEGKPLPIESGEQLTDLQFESREKISMLQHKLLHFYDKLDGKKAEVFNRRFLKEEPDTLQEIADDTDVTRQRIQQIEALLIEKLRVHLREYNC